jgi:hypothetical protein
MSVVMVVEMFKRKTGASRASSPGRSSKRHFSFAEEYHYRTECDGKVIVEGWARLPPEEIFETVEIAAIEARSRRRQDRSHSGSL